MKHMGRHMLDRHQLGPSGRMDTQWCMSAGGAQEVIHPNRKKCNYQVCLNKFYTRTGMVDKYHFHHRRNPERIQSDINLCCPRQAGRIRSLAYTSSIYPHRHRAQSPSTFRTIRHTLDRLGGKFHWKSTREDTGPCMCSPSWTEIGRVTCQPNTVCSNFYQSCIAGKARNILAWVKNKAGRLRSRRLTPHKLSAYSLITLHLRLGFLL